MADVRNHHTRAFPYGALLTKIFNHSGVNLRGQQNQGLSKRFSLNTIKKGIDFDSSEEERDVEMDYENMQDFKSVRAMVPYTLNEGVQVNPNVQEHDEGYGTDHVNEDIHEGVNMERGYPPHKAYPTKKGTLHQVVKLQTSLGEIKQ
ncbi:hypothetical protein Acr_10g0008260 [Actinidia rufa]|uniref:Uncharacterized protein n=1 Tax=Actinidia rufa TaxID=165716 RepID=A0A7J0F9W1_9ERIC|nr:hypothetical protein Acr_10g0008260 [Actinidia rufa]